jgi:cation transport regulator ChaB
MQWFLPKNRKGTYGSISTIEIVEKDRIIRGERMIEEIKKEIELYIIKNHKDRYDELVDDIWEILDKYKDKEIKFDDGSSKYAVVKVPVVQIKNKYKEAWEELKEDCREVEENNDYILYERLQQLEQKYGIGE